MNTNGNPFAVVTGASTGIGFELARVAAEQGYDLLIAADEPVIHDSANILRADGYAVDAIEADLATLEGVDKLYNEAAGRPIDVLMANAGRGLGHGFLEQDFDEVRRVIDTNITGTIYLVQKVAREMAGRGEGRVLITGSIAGYMPGTFNAVYNGTKAFINSFSFALREELKDSGVTFTCLMPGATETEFFDRANMRDTEVGQEEKDDPAEVAKSGFEAMLRGDGDIVTGWRNKLHTVMANVTSSERLAEQHRKKAEPGHGKPK